MSNTAVTLAGRGPSENAAGAQRGKEGKENCISHFGWARFSGPPFLVNGHCGHLPASSGQFGHLETERESTNQFDPLILVGVNLTPTKSLPPLAAERSWHEFRKPKSKRETLLHFRVSAEVEILRRQEKLWQCANEILRKLAAIT